MRTEENTVYLIGGDIDHSLSLRFLFESYKYHVVKIELDNPFALPPSFHKSDIVLLDLNRAEALVFKLLNYLMGTPKKPRILVMADTVSDLRIDDIFAACNIEVLLHPVNPKCLVNAIKGTHETKCQ